MEHFHCPLLRSVFGILIFVCAGCATEGPYLITYTPQMEEHGNLEIESKSAVGKPGAGDRFFGSSLALEYGVTGWWTTEVYFDGQATANQSALFTGYRWENRFRLTREEHWINPVLYAEFEDLSGASKSLLEIVGHDGEADLAEPNSETRNEHEHEAEFKLILGSYLRGWNISENVIVEKNLGHEPWEFGYAAGVSRPLALRAGPSPCNLCRENFTAGVEFYGGLGDHKSFGLADTSQYVAPILEWRLRNGVAFKMAPGFGVTASSLPVLYRFGISYEIQQIGHIFRRN